MKISPVLICIFILGSIYHAAFFHLNEVVKVADSFAYFQMSSYLSEFSEKGLGSGWFGFLYSLPLALGNIFGNNELLSGQIVNLILFNIGAYLLWKISIQILSQTYSYLVIILYFLSPTLLHFNIHILSENIYIPLFLGLFLTLLGFYKTLHIDSPSFRFVAQRKYVVYIACLIGLMYLTRAEAFIYILSIGIISVTLLSKKQITFKHFSILGCIFFLSFFLFISPYLFHLHSLTGEWGLTNKGASNLRQAELRGIERMDDAGFEQAVAELTPDKTQLIAGFAGGMDYTKPQIEGSLKEFILADPKGFISRVGQNQAKLFTRNFPEIFLGKSPNLYYGEDSRFRNPLFLVWCIIPIIVLLFGLYKLSRDEKIFLGTSIAFFIPALLFFTLFFTLNRYFLIFLPLLIIAFVYGLSHIRLPLLKVFLMGNIVSLFLLSTSVYYNVEVPKDDYYNLKKVAGEWLKDNYTKHPNIMERFPIVTYYSGTKTRYITPYTDDIRDIYKYGQYNNLDILVVDSMDFETYRPELTKYLNETPEGFSLLKEFSNNRGQKVILYTIKK